MQRWGAVMVTPALAAQAKARGVEAWLFTLVCMVLGAGDAMVSAVLSLVRAPTMGSALLVLGALGQGLLAPMLTLVVLERLLPKGVRAHGVFLLPLVGVLACETLTTTFTSFVWWTPWLAPQVGAFLCITVAGLARAGRGTGHAPRRAFVLGGLAAVVAVAAVAAKLSAIARDWDTMGPLARGESLPTFALRTPNGASMSSRELHGRVTVLLFWATWCPACRSELTSLATWPQQHRGEAVRFLAVNSEGVPFAQARQHAASFAQRTGLAWELVYDNGEVSRLFRVHAIPFVAVLGPRGHIAAVFPGRVSAQALDEAIDDAGAW